MKPKFKKSYLSILSVFALMSQAIAIITLHLKGYLVDHLIQKDAAWNYLILLVGLFALLQVFGAFLNVFSENFNRVFSVREFQRYWNLAKPRHFRRSHVENHHKLFNGLYNNIPKLFGLHVSITLQILTAIVYFGFFLGRLIHDKFWMGFLFIPIIGLFSWGASNLYRKSYQEGSKRVARDRVELSTWLELWFRSSRERTFNWFGIDPTIDNWYGKKGEYVAKGISDHAEVVFKRDLFGSLLVDWPYIFCVTIVLINVVQGYLTIGEFLIWTTLIDYLMSAFASARFVNKCQLDIKAIQDQLDGDLGWLSRCEAKDGAVLEGDTKQPVFGGSHSNKEGEFNRVFSLLSGEYVLLGLDPGFYRISGSNGSGKSTLIDTLIGFNDLFERWNPADVSMFQKILNYHTRIIERETTIFPELNANLLSQIYMTMDSKSDYENQKLSLMQKIDSEIGAPYSSLWLEKLKHLDSLWNLRPGSLSSGERVILGFFRMIASLTPKVKLIAIDECDSFLDQKTSRLFQETMQHLSKKYAIWYVSHSYLDRIENTPILEERAASAGSWPGSPNFLKKTTFADSMIKIHSYLSSVYLLGYDRTADRGFVTPCQLAALSAGSGNILGTGNVGRVLADVLIVVKRALIHHNENFRVLDQFNWQLDSVYKEAEVGEIKSAGLALAIGMLDISRQMVGLPELKGYAATGHVLLDGSIAPVAYVDEKLKAAGGLHFIKKVFSFREITHLSGLVEMLLNQESLKLNSNLGSPPGLPLDFPLKSS